MKLKFQNSMKKVLSITPFYREKQRQRKAKWVLPEATQVTT